MLTGDNNTRHGDEGKTRHQRSYPPCPCRHALAPSPHQQRLRGTTTRERDGDHDGKIRRRRIRRPYYCRRVVASYHPCSLSLPLPADDTDSERESAMKRARRDNDEVVALALALVIASSSSLPLLLTVNGADDASFNHVVTSRSTTTSTFAMRTMILIFPTMDMRGACSRGNVVVDLWGHETHDRRYQRPLRSCL